MWLWLWRYLLLLWSAFYCTFTLFGFRMWTLLFFIFIYVDIYILTEICLERFTKRNMFEYPIINVNI